jgi:hypothetical protein
MKCEDCLDVIEEYFDKELSALRAIEVAAHLVACPSCAEVHESLKQEHAVYSSYKRDIEVTPAIWQGIQARIQQEAVVQPVVAEEAMVESIGWFERMRSFFAENLHAPRFSPALAAALVIVAVGATVVVMNYLNSRNQSTQVAVQSPNTNSDNSNNQVPNNSNTPKPEERIAGTSEKEKESKVPTAPEKEGVDDNIKTTPVKTPVENVKPRPVTERQQELIAGPSIKASKLVRDAEQKYLAAIALLKRDYDKRRTKLDPQFVAKMDAALSTIDYTIAETRKVMKQNPDDPIALQYMLAAYAKKVEVLRGVAGS